MKNLCLLLLLNCLFCLPAFAQQQTLDGSTLYDSTDYDFSQKWEHLFEQIDLTTITTGFFIDRAIQFVDPDDY